MLLGSNISCFFSWLELIPETEISLFTARLHWIEIESVADAVALSLTGGNF
jgi:hypothetical protein